MAPRVAKGKVFIGGSGGEFGVRGWIAAYDAETGKEVWRFYTVPGDPSKGFENKAHRRRPRKTWSGEWWKLGRRRHRVGRASSTTRRPTCSIFGTGNGSPWNQRDARPDGRRQPVPRLDHRGEARHRRIRVALPGHAGRHLGLRRREPDDDADLTIDGKKQHVLMQPSQERLPLRAGRGDGKLLSADAFTEVNWATGIDMKTGPPERGARRALREGAVESRAGRAGRTQLASECVQPATGPLYIPTWEAYFPMAGSRQLQAAAGGFNLGIDFGARAGTADAQAHHASRRHRPAEGLGPGGAQGRVGDRAFRRRPPTSGVLATAGNLVFMGNGAGKSCRRTTRRRQEALDLRRADRGVCRADHL